MQNRTTRQPVSSLRRGVNIVGIALAVTFGSHAVLAAAQTAPTPTASMPKPGFGPMYRPGPDGGPDQRNCDGPRGAYGKRDGRLFRLLGLSADQQAQMRTLRQQSMQKTVPLRVQMRDLMQERMKLLAAPTIDRGALETLRVKQMEIANQLSRERTQSQYEMAQILTPEQRAKAYSMVEKRVERMRKHGPGHHGGHGFDGMPGGPGPMMQ